MIIFFFFLQYFMLQRLVSKLVYTWKYNSLISLLVFIAYLETIGRKIYICNIQQNFIWFFTQVILSHGLIFQKIWKRVKDFLLTSNGILVQAVVNFASFTSCKTQQGIAQTTGATSVQQKYIIKHF